ncbi:MAG TPA: hypothetical protein ENF92_03445 [Desulfobacteraceae bacterium]|nr:hypothetical protein [Desulfobacteraceae bacterium]
MDRGLFNRNLGLLRKKNSEIWELALTTTLTDRFHLLLADSGEPTLKVDDILFHNLEQPSREAQQQISSLARKLGPSHSADIRVFGLGLLYHIEEICRTFPENRVIVYEPEPMFLRAVVESRDLNGIIHQVEFKVGPHCIPWDLDFHYLHPPSLRFHSEFYCLMRKKRMLKAGNLPPLRLKILLVGPIYGGSLPITLYVKRALQKLDYRVEYVDCSVFRPLYEGIQENVSNEKNRLELVKHLNYLISQYCLAKAADLSPHLVIAMAQAPLMEETLEEMKRNGIVTSFWFVENYRVLTYWKAIAPYYDFYFTIQRDNFFEELEKVGVSNYAYLPLAADPEIHKPLELSAEDKQRYGSALSFLGAGYYNRRRLFTRLVGMDFKIWGNEWENSGPLIKHVQDGGRRVPTEECVKIYNASQINLNLHSSFTAKGVEPDGDFVNPRTFELAACQAFQLVDNRRYLSECFLPGEEVVTFSSGDQLVSLIDHYLRNEEQRNRIAQNALKRVLNEHTYERRMEKLIGTIWETAPGTWVKDLEQEKIPRHQMEKLAQDDPELREFLSSIPQDMSLSLDEVVASIEIGKRRLKDFETIFLLMKEFKNQFLRRSS